MTATQNDIVGPKGFKYSVPSFKPIQRKRISKNWDHTFVKRHIRGNHKALDREPNNNIIRTMRRTVRTSSDPAIAQFNDVVNRKRFSGGLHNNPLIPIPLQPFGILQSLKPAVFKLCFRFVVGIDHIVLCDPIGIVQHRVA